MAASSGAGASFPIDPTKPGKYPVILSDALLGKASKDAFTGVRYNHRPELSSDAAPASARIKQSAKDNTFNLGFEDNGGKYQYNGERTNNDGKYILVFDPARKAFILHRVDSMFHMNVTRTPGSSDPESLRKEFPHLTVSTFKKPPKPLPKRKNPLPSQSSQQLPRPSEPEKKEEKPKPVALSLPTISKAPSPPPPAAASTSSAPGKTEKKSKRAKTPDSDEDDDDDDGGLLIEYPDGDPGGFRPPPVPAFPPQMSRRFSEFVRDQDDDDDYLGGADADADAEFDEDEEEDNHLHAFKLPSPVNQRQGQHESEMADADADADAEADDFADDLEAELERELLERGDGMDVDESDVSEED